VAELRRLGYAGQPTLTCAEREMATPYRLHPGC